ncbi:MAG: cyclic nucleotide-binding domain-containing protein, partial [Elusimicrobia bacterium]|nr:cyclic nucleotide-binding domain-containing protein [Elusimicrobiota bacterium]
MEDTNGKNSNLGTHEDIIFIRRSPLFKDCSDDEIRRVLELAFLKEYKPGTVLFNKGKSGDVMYVIVRGEVEIFKEDSSVLATLKDGQFFGEMSIIENEIRSAGARISKPTKMVVITRNAFHNMIQADPAITSKLLMVFLKT